MSKAYAQAYAKKKKKETVPKKAQSPSVSQKTNDPKEARRQESARNVRKAVTKFVSEDRRTAGQNQKMNMPTAEQQRRSQQTMKAAGKAIKNSVKESMSDESRARAQRVKSGTQTAEDQRKMKERNEHRVEVAKNTGRAAVKGAKDTLSGYGQALADVDEMVKSNKNWTATKAAKMGIDEDDIVSRAKIEGERQQSIKEAREFRQDLARKQEKRQKEFDEQTKDATGLEKALYGAAESGTGMLIDTGIGAATGTGQFGALASMGLRTYGTTRGQAEKEGATEKEDRLYSLAQAGKEVGTELMFPGAGLARRAYGKVGLDVADKAALTLTKGLTGKKADVVSAGVRLLGGTAEENAEELAGWGLDPLLKEAIYGKNVRQRMADTLKSNLPEITSKEDADRVASYFSTSQFTDDLKKEYVSSGMSQEDASKLADQMRDYYVAYYSGDEETFNDLEDKLTRELTGTGLKGSWSMDELKDTLASTTLLTMATGLPGAATTSVRGNAIFDSDEVREAFGDNAVNVVADAVKNVSDPKLSIKAEAYKKRLDEGKDLTGTQKYELYQGYLEKVKATAEKKQASEGVIQQESRKNNYVPTVVGVTPDGQQVYAKETQMAYNEKYASTSLTTEAYSKYMESDGSISQDEMDRADAVNKAVSDLHVGGLTVGDTHEFAYGNTLAREVLKEEEGIDLNDYVVRDSKGNVDLAATNEATENALFELNAKNALAMAKTETDVYIDDTRGSIDADLLTRFGNSGQAVWKSINKDLDPRDLNTYLTHANADSYFYAAGRNTDMSVDEAVEKYGDTFKSVSNAELERAFAAGQRDRIIANTPGYGQTVQSGSNIKLKKTEPILSGQLIMDDDVKAMIPDSVQSEYLALAEATGANIHLVSDLSPVDKDGNPIINKKTKKAVQLNGMSKGNDIWLNVNTAAEQNLGYVFMHEMTHQIKQYAPNEYMALENLVRDKWFNKDYAQMQRMIKERIDLYKTKGGQSLTEEEALEEIIADAMAEAIDDPNFAAEVCEQNEAVGQQILNAIKSALRSIRDMFARDEFRNEDFHNALLSYLGILDDAEKMWLEALAVAKQNKANGLIADWQDKANIQSRYSIPATDSEGNELSEGQREFFKDSKVVDENGNLLVMYHGTPGFGFTKFDNSGYRDHDGYFFTNRRDAAESYVYGDEGGVYSVYLNLTNPMIIDADNQDWTNIQTYTSLEARDRAREIDARLNEIRGAWRDGTDNGEYQRLLDEYDELDSQLSGGDTDSWVATAKENGHDGLIILNIIDYGANYNGGILESFTEVIAFEQNQIKNTDNLNPTEDVDIRYSVSEEQREELNTDGIEELDDGTTARYSLTSWNETNKDKKLKALINAGHSEKASVKWINDINSIASIILADQDRLDYIADRSNKFLKPNGDYYKYTLDASTLCDKRRIYQGTYDAIQHMLPDSPMMQEDVVRIRTMLKEMNHKAPCGICYVESQRKNLGDYAKQWYDTYARKDEIRLEDVTTTDGLKKLKETNPEVANDFEKAMAAKGVSSPKVVKLRTDYREDIMRMRPDTVKYLNSIGGLRFHSFSDFETPHLIDTMQAVMDMSAKGLMGMAYAKVPNFAAVFGPTGIKINLSLIAKTDKNGNAVHDENGRLVFDSVEGIPFEEANKWREAYPDDVAFILVGKDKEHTLEAINDDRVDFVIPFHRSKWSAEDMRRLGLIGYEDFATGHQENGIFVSQYWDYNKTGKENAEAYLKLCAKEGVTPVFEQLLVDKGDGSYELQPDGSTDNYWKLLVEGKMYNHKTKKGAPQKIVQPNFNMEEARRVLSEYEGGANELPVAQDVVEAFVKEYVENHPDAKVSDARLSISAKLDDDYMDAVNSGDMDKAQSLVDEAAKMAGYTESLYHGTDSFGFTVIDNDAPGADGFSFWAASREDASATYTLYGKRRSISSNLNEDDARENAIEEAYSELDDAISDFRSLFDKAFDEWILGRDGNGYLRDIINDANPKPGNGDGVYDVLSEIVFDAYHRYGMDSEMEYEEWQETEEGYDIENAIGEIEAIRGKINDLENGEFRGGVYSLYANTDNLYTLDAEGKAWNELRPKDLPKKIISWTYGESTWDTEYPYKTREVAEWARDNGYDGVRFKNIKDNGPHGRTAPFDVYAFFKPKEQIKSADAVTYAEDGSVIPLSQRFDPTNNDIRYSMPTQDSEGRVLSDGQMEYFANSQARDEQGRLVPVYHTTNNGGFTIFDPSYSDDKRSLFFASNWDVSQTYGRRANKPIDIQSKIPTFNSIEDFSAYASENWSDLGWKDTQSFALNTDLQVRDNNSYQTVRSLDRAEEWVNGSADYDRYAAVFRVPNATTGFWDTIMAYSPDDIVDTINKHYQKSERQAGFYQVYLNLENPLIVDAKGHLWREIPYGPEGNSLEDHLDELADRSNLLIHSIMTVQGGYNDDGWAHTMDITIEYMKKKPDGTWYLPNTFKKTIDLRDTQFEDEGESSVALWTETENVLSDFGLPSEYITKLEVEHVDYDGDIVWTESERGDEIQFDYINTESGDYEIVDRYEYDNEDTYTTRQLAEMAEDQGYDGVIIRNCYDLGGRSKFKGNDAYSDIYIAFSSEQVKDFENENPTETPDIRYSLTPEDDALEWLASQYELDDVPLDDEQAEEGRVRMAKSKKEFVQSKNVLWNERWLTEGKILDVKSVRKSIKNVVMGAMANSNTKSQYKNALVDKTLVDAKSAYWMMKDGKHTEAAELLWDSAVKMIEDVDFFDDTLFNHYKDLRDYLRKTSIKLGEEYWSDVDYNAFRKRNYGRIKLVKGDTNVDQVLDELNELAPEWFSDAAFEKNGLKVESVPDILLQMESVLDAIQPYRIAYSSEEMEELAGDIANDLYDIVYQGEEYKSIADTFKERYDAKTKALKARHEEAMRKAKEQSEKKVNKEKERFKEYKEKEKNAKSKAKHFGSIATNIDWLTDRLLNETKDKNIPEGFRRSLAHLLMQFDMQTERSKKLEAKYGPAKKTLKMRELKDRLDKIAKEDDTGEFRYDGYLFYLMDALAEKVDGKTIDALDTEDLIVIDTMLKSIRHNFANYNKIRIQEEQVAIANIGDTIISQMRDRIAKYGQRKSYKGVRGLFDKLVNEGEETPIYYFERLDPTGDGIGAMYKELRRGEDRHIRNMDFLRNRFKQMFSEYFNNGKPGSELESWRDDSESKTFNLKNGSITLTPAQIMSLYCLSKRSQALGHILGAGIVASPVTAGQKLADQFKGETQQVESVMVEYSEVQEIIASLTEDQVKLADEMQSLLNNEMAAWGNETSLEMYGIKLFREQDYFPIKSSSESLTKTADSFDVQEKIKNFGFTKPLVRNANNAIMIDDIFSVVADHCNKMSLYNAMAIPISDFMRVYNYKQHNEDGSTKTVQQAIGEAFTRKANDYIMKFIGDVNGNTKTRSDAVNDLMNKALANYKKASIGLNMRVALQQPTAIFRALMAIDAKYFVGTKPSRQATQEMFEHCPISLWKSWGHYDMDMGRDVEDIMMNKDWSRTDAVFMGIYGELDNMTWGMIWQAAKNEVKDKHPEVEEGSPEFWELCNERASEVFDKTQVVDSIFHRSDTMRSKNTLTKMATSFMAEPTLTYNVFRDSIARANEMWKDGDREGASKLIGKMVFVLALNAAAVSASAALWDAVRGKGADDDDDKGFGALWLMNFLQNFADNANMINNIYFVKDIYGLKDGWGTSNMALEGFETFFKGWTQLKKKLTEGSDKSWYDIFMNLAGGLGYMTGYPVKTAMRDVKAVLSKLGMDVFADDGSDNTDDKKTNDIVDSILLKMGYKKKADAGSDEEEGLDPKDTKKIIKAGIKAGEKAIPKTEEQMLKEIEEKTVGLYGEDRERKIWNIVGEGYKDHIEKGDYAYIRKIRGVIERAGGDVNSFDKKVLDASRSAFKKSLVSDPTDAQIMQQQNIRSYLLEHGMSEEEISSELIYKSQTARDLKAAFRMGNENYIVDELVTLLRAGVTRDDIYKLYKYRNYGAKDYDGKYSSPEYTKTTGQFIWPTDGVITSHFGYRDAPTAGASSNHPAIDIGASQGTPVVAADGGVVISAGANGGYGNSVGIKHSNGMVTWYNHLYGWNVKVGDEVGQGQQIGQVGSTGISTGPHLDFKIMDADGNPVDPEQYLNAKS